MSIVIERAVPTNKKLYSSVKSRIKKSLRYGQVHMPQVLLSKHTNPLVVVIVTNR